jgi:hypothetical protein
MALLVGRLTPAQIGRLVASYSTGRPVSGSRAGARHALIDLGLLDTAGHITPAGRALCEWIGRQPI